MSIVIVDIDFWMGIIFIKLAKNSLQENLLKDGLELLEHQKKILEKLRKILRKDQRKLELNLQKLYKLILIHLKRAIEEKLQHYIMMLFIMLKLVIIFN